MEQKKEKNPAEKALKEIEEELQRLEAENNPASDPKQQQKLADLLYRKASLLRKLEAWDQCLQTYDRLIQRFPNPQEIDLRRLIAQALLDKGTLLLQHNQQEAGLQTYRELVERFRLDTHLGLRRLVSGAQSMIDLFESRDSLGLE